MLCAEGSIEASHLRTGQLSEEEWSNLIVAMGSLSRANIFIDDTPGIKISEIRAKCRKLAQEKGNLGLILIDYLQLIEGNGKENRQQEVSDISPTEKTGERAESTCHCSFTVISWSRTATRQTTSAK